MLYSPFGKKNVTYDRHLKSHIDFAAFQEIVIIKTRAEKLLEEKFELDDLHYAAAFFCPNTRNLKLLDNAGKQRARRVVTDLL